MRKKLSATINTPDIPTGFTELEYLEASGTQYIDTGIHPPCVATISFAWLSGGSVWSRWGVSNAYYNERGAMWSVDTKNTIWCYACYNIGDPLVSGQKNEMIHGLYETWFSFSINGKKVSTGVLPGDSLNPKNSYCFFGTTFNDRLYTATITDKAGNPLGHFLPVLDATGTPCMYDKISRTCFYNKGKGTFGYKIKNSDIVVAPTAT